MIAPRILHDDDSLVALDKPAGLATANAPAGEESLFTRVRSMLGRRRQAAAEAEGPFVGVVSRLDKPVSGVVVFAKTRAAAASLARQFHDRTVEKGYVAVCEGRFPAPIGRWVEWADAIEREEERGRDGAPKPRHASVRARVVKRLGEVSLVELEPLTGRRHQLRAQLAARGCPIVGDRMYGARLPFQQGIALHARRLSLLHPSTGQTLEIVADFPASWRPRFAPLLADISTARR